MMDANFEKRYTLADFQKEIREIMDKEASGELKTVHLLPQYGTFSPDELTEEDMAIWLKMKNGSITIEDFNVYKKDLEDRLGPDFAKTSRGIFAAFVANRGTPLFYKEYFKGDK